MAHFRRLPCCLSLIAALAFAHASAMATPSEEMSTRVVSGMTVEQLGQAIGFRPNRVEEKTCGDNDSIPFWPCRVQTYADGVHTLIVYFSKSDDSAAWQVHSWYVQ